MAAQDSVAAHLGQELVEDLAAAYYEKDDVEEIRQVDQALVALPREGDPQVVWRGVSPCKFFH